MNNTDFKKLLENSTKEKIISAVINATGWGYPRDMREVIVRELKIIERKEQEEKYKEIWSKHDSITRELMELFEEGEKA